MKWGNLINLFTLYKSSIEHTIELLVILFYPKSTLLLLNATANDMAAKLRNQRFYIVLRLLQCTDNKKQPAANLIDGNVQLHVPSHIPDNFQGVTEIVSGSLPNPSRVNIVTKENLSSSLGAAKYY